MSLTYCCSVSYRRAHTRGQGGEGIGGGVRTRKRGQGDSAEYAGADAERIAGTEATLSASLCRGLSNVHDRVVELVAKRPYTDAKETGGLSTVVLGGHQRSLDKDSLSLG